jgi:hypothetical protein
MSMLFFDKAYRDARPYKRTFPRPFELFVRKNRARQLPRWLDRLRPWRYVDRYHTAEEAVEAIPPGHLEFNIRCRLTGFKR